MNTMNLLAAAKFPLGIVAVALVLVFALITKKAKLPPLWHGGAVAMALITVAGGLALAFYQTQQETERLRIAESAKAAAKEAPKPAPSAAASAASSGQNITLGNIGASASVVIDQRRTSASGAQSIGAGSVGEGAEVDIKQKQ